MCVKNFVFFTLQKLVVKAVSLAIARDGASGGVVRTVTVSSFIISVVYND